MVKTEVVKALESFITTDILILQCDRNFSALETVLAGPSLQKPPRENVALLFPGINAL